MSNKKNRVKDLSDDGMPDEELIAQTLNALKSFMDDERFSRIRSSFKKLYPNPPQVILIEGGNADERLYASQYWSLLLNCPEAEQGQEPCLNCSSCMRFALNMHRDLFFLDGLSGSIKIDTLRDEVRPTLGEPPREARYRVVVFREAQFMTVAAANIMLKSLEEPVSKTSFLLLTPQRERLLPTLVSRSMAFTLPWPNSSANLPDYLLPWEASLCTFIETGRGLLDKTGRRGVVDLQTAEGIIHLCRLNLALALSGRAGEEGLAAIFSRMPKSRQRMADEVLAAAQDSLVYNVNPSLVIEWTVSRFFFLLPRGR